MGQHIFVPTVHLYSGPQLRYRAEHGTVDLRVLLEECAFQNRERLPGLFLFENWRQNGRILESSWWTCSILVASLTVHTWVHEIRMNKTVHFLRSYYNPLPVGSSGHVEGGISRDGRSVSTVGSVYPCIFETGPGPDSHRQIISGPTYCSTHCTTTWFLLQSWRTCYTITKWLFL